MNHNHWEQVKIDPDYVVVTSSCDRFMCKRARLVHNLYANGVRVIEINGQDLFLENDDMIPVSCAEFTHE